jgi:NAD(P)H-quinone oxidoreductase subunit 5
LLDLTLLALLAPAALTAFAFIALSQPGPRPAIAKGVSWIGGLVVIGAGLLAVAAFLTGRGAGGQLFLLDLVSLPLVLLVSVIGAVLLGFSRDYLDGEARQGTFLGWLGLTLASVLMLVSAGHLLVLAAMWIATSFCLFRLLTFYADRAGVRRMGRKYLLCEAISATALVVAVIVLWSSFGTGEIGAILTAVRLGEVPALAGLAAAMLALAAIVKSAQFPFHGWVTEVMEAPTPVSALLHAGVINAGGFLLIRFADLLVVAPGVLAALVMIGGFTALFGSVVMLAQPAIKTSLSWSTISQMGFMIFQCGLALFPIALLHIIAHSLYKAHAFLGSGDAVRAVTASRRPGPVAIPSLGKVLLAFGSSIVIYGLIALAYGLDNKSPQSIALGAILIFGIAYLLAQGLADKAPRALTKATAIYAFVAAIGYFTLQTGAELLLAETLPVTPVPGPLEWALITLALVSFGIVALTQATLPLWGGHPAVRGFRVHLSNGLYINSLTDRLLRNWQPAPSRKA